MTIDYQAFKKWQEEKLSRSVKIEMDDNLLGGLSIFVYDTEYMMGQLVKSVDEIDIKAKKKEALLATLKELEKYDFEDLSL